MFSLPKSNRDGSGPLLIGLSLICLLLGGFFFWGYIEKEYGFLGPSRYYALTLDYRKRPDHLRSDAQTLDECDISRLIKTVEEYESGDGKISLSRDNYLTYAILVLGACGSKEAGDVLESLLDRWELDEIRMPSGICREATLWAVYRIRGEQAADALVTWVRTQAARKPIRDVRFALVLLHRLSLSSQVNPEGHEELVNEAERCARYIRSRSRYERWSEALKDMGYRVDVVSRR